jgi:carboxypeptidase family protein
MNYIDKPARLAIVLQRIFFLFGLLAISYLSADAQTFRGGVSGVVSDGSGAAIAGASVRVTSNATGATRTVETGKDGEFLVPELPLGFYTVEVAKTGFQTQKVNDVEVSVSKLTKLNLQVAVAQVTETVEISAGNVVRLDTSSTALTGIVAPKQVQDLPLNGRDFRQMVQLTPGVTISGSINGSRTRGNNYQIDGADNNDAFQNASAVNQGGVSGIAGTLLPIEAIDQFSVQSGASAETGRNSGGAINLVIKSGTNNLHGSLYYFNRNEYFAANSPVAQPGSRTPKIRNNQFGFSLGGPVIKNHTFYFLTYEGQLSKAANSQVTTALSDAWVARGREILALNNTPLNPVSQNLLSLYPSYIKGLPATVSNFVTTDENDYNSHNAIVKIDHQFNDRHNISARYFGGTGDQTAYDGGSFFRPYFQVAPSRMHNFSVVQNSVLSSKLINQAVIGVNYFKQNFDIADISGDPVALGLNTGSGVGGAPTINISGFSLVGGTGILPAGRIDTTWHITDTVSWELGDHQLKLGGEARSAYLDIYYESRKRGVFNFDGTRGQWTKLTADGSPAPANMISPLRAVADFLAGFTTSNNGAQIVRGDPERTYRQNSFDLFAHDVWKITPALTLNFGARYTYNGPLYDQEEALTNFAPELGLVQVGKDIPRLYQRDLNNLAPRLGFAYALGGNDKTVIRGGYGVFYDIMAVSFFVSNGGGNGAASGISNNPGGPLPVFSLSLNGYTLTPNEPVFGAANPSPPFGVFAVDQKLRTPYVQNFNLNVQRQLARSTVLQVGYVGSIGTKLALTRNINAPIPGTTGPLQQRRPFNARYPNFGAISLLESSATSNYHSLQISLNQNNWHGLSGVFAYTFGHAIDTSSEARSTLPANSYDIANERGNAAFDVRHTFRGSFTYDIPVFFNSLPKRLTQGWQLNSILSFNTGTPINITAGTNRSLSGDGNDRVDLIGDPFANTGGRRYLNPAAFSAPPTGSFGTLARNALYGPGFQSVDAGLFKTAKITERVSAQFRFEVFNLFNLVNWGNPVTNFSAGNFGQLTNTRNGGNAPGIGQGEPRNVQLALKILF